MHPHLACAGGHVVSDDRASTSGDRAVSHVAGLMALVATHTAHRLGKRLSRVSPVGLHPQRAPRGYVRVSLSTLTTNANSLHQPSGADFCDQPGGTPPPLSVDNCGPFCFLSLPSLPLARGDLAGPLSLTFLFCFHVTARRCTSLRAVRRGHGINPAQPYIEKRGKGGEYSRRRTPRICLRALSDR